MLATTLLPSIVALALAGSATAQAGYGNISSTVAANDTTLSFGKNYAVLNLDLITALVSPLNGSAAGNQFIASVAKWNDAVHKVQPQPLTIFSRIYFSTTQTPEVGPNAPFGAAIAGLGNVTSSSPSTEVYPAFRVNTTVDVVIQKTRYYAGAGNGLEEILRTQKIDTVVLVSPPWRHRVPPELTHISSLAQGRLALLSALLTACLIWTTRCKPPIRSRLGVKQLTPFAVTSSATTQSKRSPTRLTSTSRSISQPMLFRGSTDHSNPLIAGRSSRERFLSSRRT